VTADDELEAWYRAAIAETMRPCPEYRNTPSQTLPSVTQIEHHRERLHADEQRRAA
jgi:hypothetical protein